MCDLTADNIYISHKSKLIVENVSITIRTKEVVGILGPNGAGKSTFFYILAGIMTCCQGMLKLGKQDITHLSIDKRAKLGISYLPQEASIFRKLSIKENIQAILELKRNLTKHEVKEELNRLLAGFNLENIKNNLGATLSGGERRRVEIARCLAVNPKFVLLDEPFAGVDPISVVEIKELIKELINRDIGVLITDHNVRETLAICNRAYIMNRGQIVSSGKPTEILNNQVVRDIYLGTNFSL